MGEIRLKSDWTGVCSDAFRNSRQLLLFFDYDGTLTPIVRHPSLAFLPHKTRSILAHLAELPDITIAVVSGRSLADVKGHVGLKELHYAGSGGLELEIGGEHQVFPGSESFGEILTLVHEYLVEPLGNYPGTWVERKHSALSIHFRGLLPLSAVCFRAEVANTLVRIPQIRFRVVSEAIEITPADGWDKGTTVEMFLSRARRSDLGPVFPVYFGDSPNDEEGMAATLAAGGLAIGIGTDAPQIASIRLETPELLANDLAQLYAKLAQARGIPARQLLENPEKKVTDDTPIPGERLRPGLLVVDPDTHHRGKLIPAMEELGWRVWGVESATEANRLLAERSDEVHVAIIDLELPGLLGARTLADWEQIHPTIMRCGMATVTPYMASAFQRLSDTPLFCKPIVPDVINRKLREKLQSSPTNR